MKVGLLTSGGDAQGLNAAIRGVAKTLYQFDPNVKIYGIQNGYYGLIDKIWRYMEPSEFSGILTLGGTILGTSRKPGIRLEEVERQERMLQSYREGGFDALVILGGDGTHKDAYALSQLGVNVVTLPKTIDNDLYGTDLTFGFDSAVNKATAVIDAIHTTAASHGRVFIVELMGNHVGWISLYSGIAGGADIILIPEIPYKLDKIVDTINTRNNNGKHFTIIAIAEGTLAEDELGLSEDELKSYATRASSRLAHTLEGKINQDTRIAVPGHFQRGGEPTPTDRILCSRFGAKAGEMIFNGEFGKMVALHGDKIVAVPLSEVAGKLKSIPLDSEILRQARDLGVCFGD